MLPSVQNDKIYKQLLTLFCLQHSKYKMAPPFEKKTEEVSSLSDENIIYPIIALTIVMLRLGCGVSIFSESGFFFIEKKTSFQYVIYSYRESTESI